MKEPFYTENMYTCVSLKLMPNEEQRALLVQTMRAFNRAANMAARAGFDAGVFSQPAIHKLAYYAIREETGLPSQLAVRAIGRAVACFQRDKRTCPEFKATSSACYDTRVMSFKGITHVSLATVGGRVLVPMAVAGYHESQLGTSTRVGQSDLVFSGGRFSLRVTVEIDDVDPMDFTDVLGVDLGIVNIATDSDGTIHCGVDCERKRLWFNRRRQVLQSVGSKSAKRRLRKMSGRERSFRQTVNHQVARAIVDKAASRGAAIAIEDLTGIRSRVRRRRGTGGQLGSWSFRQLRLLIEHKAALAGVTVLTVDPRGTSKSCSRCGHCDAANRKSQEMFSCVSCGLEAHADVNAAVNIRNKGLAASPMVGDVEGEAAKRPR